MATCTVCSTTVFKAEEVISSGKSYHKTCFKCWECKKVLALGDEMIHETNAYCKSCYAKHFGHQGTSNTFGNLSAEAKHASIDVRSFKSDFVDPLSQKPSPGDKRTGAVPISVVAGSTATIEAERNRHALRAAERGFDDDDEDGGVRKGVESMRFEDPMANMGVTVKAKYEKGRLGKGLGGGEKCRKCEKSVGPAEKLTALGGVWHKGICFACQHCNKPFQSAAEAVEAKGNPCCKACYAKHHGPKGVGFGVM